ncbi:NAD(P)-binding protein [Alkaliphilus pronyensis]|uniref:NAD(P)-binding protein n=1 Tax=Alkaliphilus pronyensis TaxID=1482732 RepID=A0A6I0EVZ0_9FIRM|nr:FAD-dependent oxidoreductase [Alkaliphilus pronyensis]KAB3530760.1 NAD(P)-binding protein [Alkaliphilus pronyensis]
MGYAIVGAGFSGMLAAYLLEKRGIDVTVYEKQEYTGGHCRTIVNKDLYVELGTVFCFSEHIKELLIELDIEYTERFTYRNFLDANFSKVEQVSREKVASLMDELKRLTAIIDSWYPTIKETNYGYIDKGLMVSLYDFFKANNLNTIIEVVGPHLSSFGFGDIKEIPAYYGLNVFNVDTIYYFIKGNKLLFINTGFSEVIYKLSKNISDIRYNIEVKNIQHLGNKVKVETEYGYDVYDKVLVTTKLPKDVIKDGLYNRLMMKIDTNPYITCAYEVENKNLVTTYYKAHLGQREKIQFFHTFKQSNKTILVAYCYGLISKQLINSITYDIKASGIKIKHLITPKQWFIFPHLKADNLTENFYVDIKERQKETNICLIGSLVSKPSISNLYVSIKEFIDFL